ncbi:MAG: V-type ATP synthase subunit C [Actinobacteria bacterium HGW-Actinobacteria-10]|nr:MAG: V-type ATP synthase subunit C [Actinobacteria bacterium HGW-Actinobacteria-10]
MSPTPAKTDYSQSSGKDYGYANARIRGMKSRLLDNAYFDALIATPDIQRLIQDLSETEYGPDLEDTLIHGRDAAAVDEALKNNMVRTFQKVLGFLNPEAAYLMTTLLGRWDVFNIKTVLRGKQMHLTTAEIAEGMLPAGQLSLVDLEALAMQDDIRAIVDTAVTWGLPYASALREGHTAFMKSGELADMELALDRYYTMWAADRLSRRGANTALARRILAIQVDISNLVMAFRLLSADAPQETADTFFLEGGADVSIDLYRELASMSDIDEVLDRMRGTPYGRPLDDVAMKYLEENSIAVFERALEDYLMRRALGFGRGDPLGVGVAIAYLWAKQNEITNLRIVVKGKSVGMPVERVRGELILV